MLLIRVEKVEYRLLSTMLEWVANWRRSYTKGEICNRRKWTSISKPEYAIDYCRTMQTVQSYLTPLTNAIRNPSSVASRTSNAAGSAADTAVNNPQSFLARVRDMDSATLLAAGIVTAETIGFFCVGEMIGRFKIIGYRGGHSEHH